MSDSKKFDFTFSGQVVEVGDTKTYASGFKKRTVVIDDSPKDKDWKNPVPFQFFKDDVSKLDGISVGMTVEVSGYFKGRKWEGPKGVSWFCDNTVYGEVKVVSAPEKKEPVKEDVQGNGDCGDEDLPF